MKMGLPPARALPVANGIERSIMRKKSSFIALAILVGFSTYAHTLPKIETSISPLSAGQIAMEFLQLGFSHVLPKGVDHILFIVGIFFLRSSPKSVILQCSIFTIAHSITLGLSAGGYLLPRAAIIEPMIALSIAFVGIENLFQRHGYGFRLSIIFAFGLVHGMGFASVLQETGLPANHFLPALICFNVGVELAQLAIIIGAYFAIAYWFKNAPWYRSRIVIPVSLCISAIAIFWTIERIFFV